MITERSQIAINEILSLFDHLLEEHGFGWDHWHSILWNLHNVEPEQWTLLPESGGRTIRELVVHIGASFLSYENHAFGDQSRDWNDLSIGGVSPGDTPEETVRWLRMAHGVLRDRIATLTDDQLDQPRRAPWGKTYETRRLLEIQIQHTLYHTGEINHIRALLQGNDDWDSEDLGREDA